MRLKSMSLNAYLTRVKIGLATLTILPMIAGLPSSAFPEPRTDEATTTTPVKHVIAIIGENRTFDSVYATYKPREDQTISNLLSKGIITDEGGPGEAFSETAQSTATVTGSYAISPSGKTPYTKLPPQDTSYAPQGACDDLSGKTACSLLPPPAPFATLAAATAVEGDLLPADNFLLLTGATGLPNFSVDTRVANVNNLANGVYQLTGDSLPYDSYTGDMNHRFYQMWQQYDCSAAHISNDHPNGCLADLLTYVGVTIGAGNGGKAYGGAVKAYFEGSAPYLCTGEGSNTMSFYNVQQGDASYLKFLADHYTLDDNYHQPVMGGTMVQHMILGYADLPWYSDGNGHAIAPPANQVENPNPQAGSNNYYTNDGGGAVYTNCADLTQPGVKPIADYLASLPHPIATNCEAGYYYGLNNQSPAISADGKTVAPLGSATVPATTVRHIGDALSEKHISWVYYGGHWDRAVNHQPTAYCNICNPFHYALDIMSSNAQRTTHIKDTADLHQDIQNGTLPAVAYVKPDGLLDGHPASSKLSLFEGFTHKIISELQANETLWKETAVFITFDEGGGLYDSGYIQPLDYFGDGPRIPLLVVSPFTKGGRISHAYGDHASIVKFIERNWGLDPLTNRSRDNFPNPVVSEHNPYEPLNPPALSDLFDVFKFGEGDFGKDE